RSLGISGEAGQHRSVAFRVANVAASMSSRSKNGGAAKHPEDGAENPLGEKMAPHNRVNILMVDDQPGKLLSYEAILSELGENLIKAASAREALELLLKHEIAVILVDVCMPELDGFQLAAMIREHPRFQKTAIIFISAI